MEQDADYQRLLDWLNTWAQAHEVSPGRLVVTFESAGVLREAEIHMTPDQWDDMWEVMWGSLDDAVSEVRHSLLSLKPGERYLVFGEYELNAARSLTDRHPEEPSPEQMMGGRWSFVDAEGIEHFADEEPEPSPARASED